MRTHTAWPPPCARPSPSPPSEALISQLARDKHLDPATGVFVEGGFAGLDNYLYWITNRCMSPSGVIGTCPPGVLATDFWPAVGITLFFTVVTVALAFPVAYFLSFVVRPDHKSLWLFLITIPFWTSYLIRVFLWKVILGYNGVINSGLKSLGIIEQPLSFLLYNTGSIVMTLSHSYAPFAILPIYVALEKIDRSLLEAGRDLGESRLMTFWRVTLPQLRPATYFLSITVLLNSLQVFDIINVMTRGGPLGNGTTTMVYQVYEETFRNFRAGYGATVATIMFVVLLVVTVVQVRVMDRAQA